MSQPLELPSRTKSILVIGAGELGSAILEALTSHPLYRAESTQISVMIRPTSLTSPTPEKSKQQENFRRQRINLVGGDVEASSERDLTEMFRSYTAVLHAGGMTAPPGTMLKVTRAVIASAGQVQYYVPWQHGVDYDVIGREGGQGLFSEQVDVRELLRSQTATNWVVLSCGVFMSFLFEEFWGVVTKQSDRITVTALNSWDDWITTTTAEDIAKCTAELLFRPETPVNKPVYIAGDTLTYGEFADTVERAAGQKIGRQVWPLDHLRQRAHDNPDDKLLKYRVVFSEGRGLSWPKAETWSSHNNIKMETVEEWIARTGCLA